MEFYTNATIIQDFKNYIRHLITHKNPYTGLTYAEDPTVAMYETGNELGGPTFGDMDVPNAWTEEISASKATPSHPTKANTNTASTKVFHQIACTQQINRRRHLRRQRNAFRRLGNRRLLRPLLPTLKRETHSRHRFRRHRKPRLSRRRIRLDRHERRGTPRELLLHHRSAAAETRTRGRWRFILEVSYLTPSNSHPLFSHGELPALTFRSLFEHDVPDCTRFVNHTDGFTLQYGNPAQADRIGIIRQHFYRMLGETAGANLPPVACPGPVS